MPHSMRNTALGMKKVTLWSLGLKNGSQNNILWPFQDISYQRLSPNSIVWGMHTCMYTHTQIHFQEWEIKLSQSKLQMETIEIKKSTFVKHQTALKKVPGHDLSKNETLKIQKSLSIETTLIFWAFDNSGHFKKQSSKSNGTEVKVATSLLEFKGRLSG